MTTRLGHSLGAMRRLVQMTATRVTIYVEGRVLDPDFYGRVCGPVCSAQNLPYEIIIGDRIAGGGGKGILIKLFEYMRGKKALIDRTGAHPKLVMFYLDKDTDDIFRKKRRSDHLVYSSMYCIENHLYCDGDLVSSIATGGSVDSQVVSARIPDPIQWRKSAAIRWQEWIALCLAAQKLGLGGAASYGVDHSSIDSRVNPANLAVCRTDLQSRSGRSAVQLNRVIAWAQKKADSLIRLGEHDQVFKGKWYAVFAMHEFDQMALSIGPINHNGAKDRLIGSLVATLRIDEPWAEHYKDPLRRAIGGL
jgi:hypothetical protein